MQADANPMLERHAFPWQCLCDRVAEALRRHAYTLEYRTLDQLTPLCCWLTLIKTVLRRLILMAATTTQVDMKPRWTPAPAPEPEPETPPETPLEAPGAPPEPDAPPTPNLHLAAYCQARHIAMNSHPTGQQQGRGTHEHP